jgi:quaternary ammonium compound-resistance protein SugE
MAQLIFFFAGLAKAAWVIGLKNTASFAKLIATVISASFMAVSFVLLAHALKSLPLGTVYAVWVGIGTVGKVIAGIILSEKSRNLVRFCASC